MNTRVALGVLALCCYTVAQSADCDSGKYTCPGYTVLQDEPAYELRNYSAATWIATGSEVTGPTWMSVRSMLFTRLYDYIQGANTQNVIMSMTAPVLTKVTPPSQGNPAMTMTMSFYISAPHDTNTPVPSDPSVEVISWTDKQFYVRSFTGLADWELSMDNLIQMKAAIGDDLLYVNTYAISAAYDDPQQQEDDQRYNELWLAKLY